MPLIEVLPQTTTTSAPGWAYVPDTGYDPSKAPILPSGARQRAATRITAVGDGETSVRQQNAITKHLIELDKDNHRDVVIAIPTKKKGRDAAERGIWRATLKGSPSNPMNDVLTADNYRQKRQGHPSCPSNITITEDVRQLSGRRRGAEGAPKPAITRSNSATFASVELELFETVITQGPPSKINEHKAH
jgi:zinc finger HIT domain-containing protein 1